MKKNIRDILIWSALFQCLLWVTPTMLQAVQTSDKAENIPTFPPSVHIIHL
jgi:hypothetical protein